ncbi:putative RNA-directed DNA polymerase from transposon BS [Trichonephila clavipes]|nr:putative RNA-directed DNA polymerase from transposon BS [Trichonephila clavipes]
MCVTLFDKLNLFQFDCPSGGSPSFRVSAADKGCRVYPLNPRPGAVALYSGCTLAWFLPDDRHTASLVGLRGGWRHARMKFLRVFMDPNMLCPGKDLVLPTLTVDQIAAHSRFLLISLPNKSPFAIHKAILGIGGEPKSIKRLRSGDLLLETISDLQTKSFLLAKTFLNSPVNVSPHKTLNSCRGVISESDLLSTPESEILEGFSDQGVIQVRRITIKKKKKDSNIMPTKHLILTFNSPKLPTTVKGGYLNCKIRAYIPNPLRCFKCQRNASIVHSLTPDSKQCPKWKVEKEIQAIKTNRNISYLEARKLIAPQLSQTYAQVAKPSTVTSTTQTDENITLIQCPPLQLLQPLLSVPQPDKSNSVSTLSSATQADLLPSTFSIAATISEPPHLIPVSDTLLSTTSNMFIPIEPSSSIISASTSNSSIQPPSASSTQNLKKVKISG